MRVLLLGANGQVGRALRDASVFSAAYELVPASRDGLLTGGGTGEVADLDAPDRLAPLLDRVRPHVIVNAAAYTAVDRAEQEEPKATRINGEAVGKVAGWAAANGALVVHYSTDYVFDGNNDHPYAVDAVPRPLGAYGRSKLAGEQALAASGADFLIFRTAWVYAPQGHNFLRTMLRLAAEREELRVVADQHGAPTTASLIARATAAALDRWHRAPTGTRKELLGTHHLVASGATTWHGFATAIVDEAAAAGLISRSPRITPIATANFPTPATRPAWSVLDNTEFQRCFDFPLPPWQEGLRTTISEITRDPDQ